MVGVWAVPPCGREATLFLGKAPRPEQPLGRGSALSRLGASKMLGTGVVAEQYMSDCDLLTWLLPSSPISMPPKPKHAIFKKKISLRVSAQLI